MDPGYPEIAEEWDREVIWDYLVSLVLLEHPAHLDQLDSLDSPELRARVVFPA